MAVVASPVSRPGAASFYELTAAVRVAADSFLAFSRTQAGGTVLAAPDDNSRPAQFLVNLARTERMSVANAVAHEAYPGHHLQRIAARRAAGIHPVMQTLSFGGFSEGWGIYAERLGDEMGLYESRLDRAGYLVHLLDVMVAAYGTITLASLGAKVERWIAVQRR